MINFPVVIKSPSSWTSPLLLTLTQISWVWVCFFLLVFGYVFAKYWREEGRENFRRKRRCVVFFIVSVTVFVMNSRANIQRNIELFTADISTTVPASIDLFTADIPTIPASIDLGNRSGWAQTSFHFFFCCFYVSIYLNAAAVVLSPSPSPPT